MSVSASHARAASASSRVRRTASVRRPGWRGSAMRDLFVHRWQYGHFAGLWEMNTPRQRVIFCQQCDGVTPATNGVCVGCGTELFDPFAIPSHAEA